MLNQNIVVLRVRKGIPGIGRKLARHFNANEVTCGFRPKLKVPDNALVLNYGRSTYPIWYEDAFKRGVRFINTPTAVGNSVDKRVTFELLSNAGVPTLDWSTHREVALEWLESGENVVVRSTVSGKKGKGINLLTSGDAIPHAPLYTKFYDQTHEFRVHVANDKVVDYIQKKRMGRKKLDLMGIKEVNMLIRNRRGGWVFCHHDIVRSKLVEQVALDAVKVLGLDFAGMDIMAKAVDGEVVDAVVCESNSAPAISSPTTFAAYTNEFNTMLEERTNGN